MKAQRGSRGITLLFLYAWCKMGVGGQHHAPAALPLGKRTETYSYFTGDWVGLSGWVW